MQNELVSDDVTAERAGPEQRERQVQNDPRLFTLDLARDRAPDAPECLRVAFWQGFKLRRDLTSAWHGAVSRRHRHVEFLLNSLAHNVSAVHEARAAGRQHGGAGFPALHKLLLSRHAGLAREACAA
jgi:hypothetical protein